MQPTKNTLTFAATGTDKTGKLQENGIVQTLTVVTPNFTNTVTTTITIEDLDGHILYTSSALSKNATTRITGQYVPTDYGYTIRATLSGDAGGSGGDVIVKTYVEKR